MSPFERMSRVLCEQGYTLKYARADLSGGTAVFQDDFTGTCFPVLVPFGALPDDWRERVLKGESDASPSTVCERDDDAEV